MQKHIFAFLCLAFCITPTLFSASDNPLLIITHSYNEPEFIGLQEKTFKKFLKDPYEFVVFNDAKNEDMANKILQTCLKLNIRCIRFPQHLHTAQTPADRHGDIIQFSLEQIGFDHPGIVLMIDSDMFLIKDFCAKEFLQGYQISGCHQARGHVYYIWPGLVFMDMPNLPNKKTLNFRPGRRIEGQAVDTGGHTYLYLKNNPSVKIKYLPGEGISHLPKDPAQLKILGYSDLFISLLEKGLRNFALHTEYFLHYYAGSNWMGDSENVINKKKVALRTFLDALVAQ